jgi:putative redox protein
MDAKVVWKSGMSFTGSAESGFSLPLGAEAVVGGAEDGFRPTELILTGLAGCTAMDVISILLKKRQEITAFEVQARAPRSAEHPKVFLHATLDYHITGRNVSETAVVRAIELSASRYCPAQAMLGKVFPIELKYHIYEDQDGETALVHSGEWLQQETSEA